MKQRAFTLIELMVVVAIIAVIAAILIPNFLRARDRARNRPGNPAVEATARPAPEPPVAGSLAEVEGLHSRLRLRGWSQRMGMDVVHRYALEAQLDVAVWAGSGRELRVPFPRLCDEASNVVVELQTAQGRQPFAAWQVSPWGLVVQAPPGKSRMRVRFLAQGKDQMVLDLPSASRRENLKIELAVEPGLEVVLAQTSLQPTSGASGCWGWEYRNLVSESPIVLELPVSHSLMGKIFSLCRLAGGAVFLFGLGFWYLGELYRPGQLNTFGWGHFLMLALNYCLFFPVLAVLSLSQQLPLGTALPLTATLSLPLLSLHVWRSVDLRFALLYNLPLALGSLSVVVGAVFVEAWRDVIMTGAGVFSIAFVTWTLPRWRQHRYVWQLAQEKLLRQRLEEQCERVEACGDPTQGPEDADKAGLETARRRWRTARELRSKAARLGQGVPEPELYSNLSDVSRNLDHWLDEHSLWMEEWRSRQAREIPAPVCSQTGHCCHCGQGGEGRFCSGCGSERARLLHCGCGTRGWWPAQLPGWQHCPGCGQAGLS